MKLRLTVEYAGEAFCGWQQQDGLQTVQGELEKAVGIVLAAAAKKQNIEAPNRIPISGSGRTDSGVHAMGQVASFNWPDTVAMDTYELRGALNGITPRELCVRSVEVVDDSFDARATRHIKQYSYHIGIHRGAEGASAKRMWQVYSRLDVPAMIRAAKYFKGEQDFTSFRALDCSAKTSVRRILVSELNRVGPEHLVYVVQGNGFLKQMIRIVAGTIVGVGKGILSADDIPKIIAAKSRRSAGETAPACGLVMDWVKYDFGKTEIEDEEEE